MGGGFEDRASILFLRSNDLLLTVEHWSVLGGVGGLVANHGVSGRVARTLCSPPCCTDLCARVTKKREKPLPVGVLNCLAFLFLSVPFFIFDKG